MKALASASDWLAVRDSSRWLPSGKVTARAAGDLGHGIGAEARNDRVERGDNRRQRAEQRLSLDPQSLL
jgi:hypothetical protein